MLGENVNCAENRYLSNNSRLRLVHSIVVQMFITPWGLGSWEHREKSEADFLGLLRESFPEGLTSDLNLWKGIGQAETWVHYFPGRWETTGKGSQVGKSLYEYLNRSKRMSQTENTILFIQNAKNKVLFKLYIYYILISFIQINKRKTFK